MKGGGGSSHVGGAFQSPPRSLLSRHSKRRGAPPRGLASSEPLGQTRRLESSEIPTRCLGPVLVSIGPVLGPVRPGSFRRRIPARTADRAPRLGFARFLTGIRLGCYRPDKREVGSSNLPRPTELLWSTDQGSSSYLAATDLATAQRARSVVHPEARSAGGQRGPICRTRSACP